MVGGQVSARETGDAYGPCSTPSAITLYTASVGCVPSQDPYVDGSLQTEHPGMPHGTVWFPQQVRRAFVNPASRQPLGQLLVSVELRALEES